MQLFYILLILIFFPFSSYSQISLNKLSTGLSNLWGISVLNDKEILLTQRKGNVFKLNIFNKNIKKIKGVPKVVNFGQGGLLDIAVEDINKNKKVYLCLSDKVNTTKSATTVHSYDLKNNILLNKKLLFKSNKPSNSSRHFGCRLAIKGEFIFATIGDRGSRHDAQNFANHSGSVIKIKKMDLIIIIMLLKMPYQKFTQLVIAILKDCCLITRLISYGFMNMVRKVETK